MTRARLCHWLLACAWGACALGVSAQIRIGQTVGVTGTVAATVKESMLGAQLVFDQVNAKGGVGGEKIEVTTLDDAFDVFGVHGVAGILGGLLTPVFALTAIGGQGFAEGRGLMEQLQINAGAILFSISVSAVTSWVAFKLAAALCGGLRVDEEAEVDGLDLSAHGEVGYKYSN